MKYKVEMRYAGGWDDAGWTEDNGSGELVPVHFSSIQEAQLAINEHVRDCAEAVAEGNMQDGHEPSDYRAIPVDALGFFYKVYDVLEADGARRDDRLSFVRWCFVQLNENQCTHGEWRFMGSLGYGGKYWIATNTVRCYREDETPARIQSVSTINQKLKEIQ